MSSIFLSVGKFLTLVWSLIWTMMLVECIIMKLWISLFSRWIKVFMRGILVLMNFADMSLHVTFLYEPSIATMNWTNIRCFIYVDSQMSLELWNIVEKFTTVLSFIWEKMTWYIIQLVKFNESFDIFVAIIDSFLIFWFILSVFNFIIMYASFTSALINSFHILCTFFLHKINYILWAIWKLQIFCTCISDEK